MTTSRFFGARQPSTTNETRRLCFAGARAADAPARLASLEAVTP
jgi:hypothetical protein